VFGLVLLLGIPVLFVTGMLSYAAYNPGLGRLNDQTPDKGLLGFYLFDWPTHPYWLYRLTQGGSVTAALLAALTAAVVTAVRTGGMREDPGRILMR
jgi:hypothetical protein